MDKVYLQAEMIDGSLRIKDQDGREVAFMTSQKIECATDSVNMITISFFESTVVDGKHTVAMSSAIKRSQAPK